MQEVNDVPRLIISSYKGKNGKTVATLAIASALIKKGINVSMFKVGPDFIDPSYHEALTGMPSRNLDHVLMKDKVVDRFNRFSNGKGIAIIEGVAGLFDSPDGITEEGSTAQMAKILKSPVIIVINGERINRTAGAILQGLRGFDKDVKLAGVILTNVVPQQVDKMSKIINDERIELLGFISKSSTIEKTMGYRHLGLVHAREKGSGEIAETFYNISGNINAEKVMMVARENVEPLNVNLTEDTVFEKSETRIGILSGRSFTFYYPETIEIASKVGKVEFIDPERDQSSNVDLILIGGGFPEIYSDMLEKNKPFRSYIRTFIERGGYLYAECGGLMYLTDSIVYNGGEYKMVGIIDAVSVMFDRPVGHGYARGITLRDTPFATKGTMLLGHEFHYSKLVLRSKYDFSIKYEKGTGINGLDGFNINNSYAHFMHIHPETYDYISQLAKKVSINNETRQ
ncbi:MAG: cobyrinate a,c-diamide synthase [Conexivisphaerales archaeon]